MDKKIAGGRDILYYNYTDMENLRITKIIKVGDSFGIIIPKEVLTATGLARGDQVFVAVREDLSVQLIKNTFKIIS